MTNLTMLKTMTAIIHIQKQYFKDGDESKLRPMKLDDISKLMQLLLKLRESGNTVVVIEHNVDVMKCADWIIDLGPGGGDAGGNLVCEGPPEVIRKCGDSLTGRFL